MKDNKTKEDFIFLRAAGHSFDTISKEIKVSKPTLIKWQKEFKAEIGNITYLNVQSLIEKYKINKEKSIEHLLTELNKIDDAIKKKKYDDLSLKDLHYLYNKLNERFIKILATINYKTGEFETQIFNDIDFGEKEIIYPLIDEI